MYNVVYSVQNTVYSVQLNVQCTVKCTEFRFSEQCSIVVYTVQCTIECTDTILHSIDTILKAKDAVILLIGSTFFIILIVTEAKYA